MLLCKQADLPQRRKGNGRRAPGLGRGAAPAERPYAGCDGAGPETGGALSETVDRRETSQARLGSSSSLCPSPACQSMAAWLKAATVSSQQPCYAMLICAALSCAVLCHAMPCHAMQCYAMLCCAVLHQAMLCHDMPLDTQPHRAQCK